MVEAVEPFKLHITSMSYLYEVFEHLQLMRMFFPAISNQIFERHCLCMARSMRWLIWSGKKQEPMQKFNSFVSQRTIWSSQKEWSQNWRLNDTSRKDTLKNIERLVVGEVWFVWRMKRMALLTGRSVVNFGANVRRTITLCSLISLDSRHNIHNSFTVCSLLLPSRRQLFSSYKLYSWLMRATWIVASTLCLHVMVWPQMLTCCLLALQ